MTTNRKNTPTVNVAARLTEMAKLMPDAVAVVEPLGYDAQKKANLSPGELSAARPG